MKKRFISKLLMAALVVVTMGVFSSCKDYDDDINANTALINQLQSQVKALEEARRTVEQNIQTLTAAADAAQKTADKAVKDAETAQKAAEAAQKAADAAQGTADQAIKDAEAAQKTADAAALAAKAAHDAADAAAALAVTEAEKAKLAAIEEAQKKVDALYEQIKKEFVSIQDFEDALAKKADLSYVNNKLAEVNKVIDSLAVKMKANEVDAATKYQEVKDSLKKHYDGIKDLETKYLWCQAEIAALGKDIARIDLVNKNQSDSIAANFAAIAVLKEQILQVEKNRKAIEALEGRAKGLEDRVKALEDANFIKNADLDDANSAVRKMMAAVAAAATDKLLQDLTSENGLITKLQKATKQNADSIQINAAAIKLLQDFQAEATKKLNANAASIDSLAKVTKDLEDGKVDWATFNELKGVVEGHTTQLGELMTWYKAVKDNVAKIPQMLTDIQTALTNAANAQKAADNAQATANKANTRIDSLNTEINKKYGQLLDSISAHRTDLNKLFTEVSNLKSRVSAIEAGLNTLVVDLNSLFLFVDRSLTSIVTKPDYWTYGFPTIEATIIAAQPVYTFTGRGTVGSANYTEVANGTQDPKDFKGYSFKLKANYWMNPHTINYKDYDYSFDEIAAKNYVTRGNRDELKAGIKPIDTEKDVKFDAAKGVLTVEFQFENGENVNDARTIYEKVFNAGNENPDPTRDLYQDQDGFYMWNPQYAWTTTLALQAKRKGAVETSYKAPGQNGAELNGINEQRVITSDYGIVVPTYLDNLLLGNNEYKATGHKEATGAEQIGNQKWHLWRDFNRAKAENAEGRYSFELYLDNTEGLSFNDYVDVHYNGCLPSNVWTNKQAQDKGFTFEYTLLTNTDVWECTKDGEFKIKEGAGKAGNTGNDKAAIVRVELKADGSTFAYGYITVLMKNKDLPVEVEMDLTLDCDEIVGEDLNGNPIYAYTADYSWDDFIDLIEDELGQEIDWSLANFAEAPAGLTDVYAGPYKKFANANTNNADTEHAGQLAMKDGKLTWTFTHEEVIEAFYEADGITPANTKDYATIIKILPNIAGEAQGVAPIVITVKIASVTYPSGTFSVDGGDRITSNWFQMYSNEKTSVPDERYEIHVNDEAPGESTSDNEIKYDVTSAFVKNQFKFTGATGFEDIPEKADLFFNQAKYFIYTGTNGTKWDKNADYILTGAHSGNKYVMYVLDPKLNDAGVAPYTKLYAALITNGVADFSDAANNLVAVLTGEHNELVTFQTTDNAKDLLNHARHDQLGKDETFTSHMIMHVTDYCLPVEENGKNTFDIRYLRPISANVAGQKKVYDAKDDGNNIFVADLVSFIDWRKHEFAANGNTVKVPAGQPATNWNGYQYMAYYGITTIKADFDKARSNVHVGQLSDILDANGIIVNPEAWPTIKEITEKINFYPDANAEAINAGGTADVNTGWTADYTGFRIANGYYRYENNSGGTTDFYIILPVSVVYYWGETQPEWILIEVKGTEGQGNHARQF